MGELVCQIKMCPRCGAELVQPDKNSSEWKCASCRTIFAPEVHKALSKQMAEIARNVVDEAFEEKIAEHRRTLWAELQKDITERSSREIVKHAQSILAFNGDDIQADFYLTSILEHRAKPIVKFLNKLAKRNPDLYRHYVEDFVCFLTESFEENFVMPLRALISKAFAEGSKEYKKCQDLVDAVVMDKGTHNVRQKRDVFVACSSKDKEIVWELVQYLESEDRTKESKGRSLSCFFYERNLPKGRKADQHYQDRLKEAIENCKVFLFASSQNSRTKDCDAYSEELSLLKEVRFANKERVEWILDSVDARLSTPDPDVCESIERIFKGNTWHIGTSKEDMQEVYNAIMQCLDYQSEKTSKTSVANVSSEEKKLAAFEYEKLSNGKYIIKKLKNSEELYVVVPDCVEIISQNTFADSGVIEVTLPEGLIRIGKGAFSGCQYLETINIPTSLKIIDEETFLNCTQLDLEPPSGVRCGKDAFKNTRYSIRVEEERKRKEEECKLKEEETRKREEEEARKRKEEEVRKREEDERKRKEEDERRRKEAEERERKEEEKRKRKEAEARKREEEEHKRKEAEARKREEEERKRKDAEARKREEEERKRKDAEARKREEEEERKRKEAEARKREEEEHKRKEEEEHERTEAEKRKYTDGLQFELDGDSYNVSKYSGTSLDVIIPEIYNDLPVTSIKGGYWMMGTSALYGFSNLTSITIPKSVTNIGDSVFHDCSSLTSITVLQGNPVYHSAGNCLIETKSKKLIVGCKTSLIPADGSVKIIGNFAFSCCSDLVSILIPNRVTSIGDHAFSRCSSLANITLPYGVESIGASAFKDCRSLTSITIPNSIVRIGADAFYGCINLKTIVIPDGVKQIEHETFSGCNSLTDIKLSSCLTSIDSFSFAYCRNLMSITIPNSVKRIGADAFSDCSSFTSITIPDSVTSIGDNAFENCGSLTKIKIPSSVTSLGKGVFRNCGKLETITFSGTVEQWKSLKKWYVIDWFSGSYTVHCTDGKVTKNGFVI